jgi:acyl-CoA dehydrogenase
VTALVIVIALLVALGLTYAGRAWLAGVVATAFLIFAFAVGTRAEIPLCIVWLAVVIATGVRPIRRRLITRTVMRQLAPRLPHMSETERIALEAGTTWWDAELFSGAPDWQRIANFGPPPLSDKERAFLDGPCTQLCRMLDDHVIRAAGDLPLAVWSFIKRERFMGMIIPEAYGGLGFSAAAHSAVIAMLASRSAAACVTVMVPNSLGPAELLLRYGTDEQKQYYLPRLAVGEEVPCFALTEPHAGSDAAGIRSRGTICKGRWRGREVLGIRLTWDKRYITLAPVATVLGLAFQLFDPDHLLGDRSELGITCALIPVQTSGVWIGDRHDPMSVPFQNGPTRGTEVFVPLDQIIGGPAMVGQGWRMLMESLSAGRSLSLPADAVGSAQLATRVIGAYAAIREQFGLPIGRFEGVEAALGRIAGTMHWMNAMRVVTAGAVDSGERPSVISAIAKCWSTEALRRIANDAMDVAGGAGICKGPHNVLAHIFEGVPIGITVEGANLLTRSLIVFGQGAIRCHPFALAELRAAHDNDLGGFDRALAGHVNFMLKNAARAFTLATTGAALSHVSENGPAGSVMRTLERFSAAFALVTDTAMATLGGSLKRKENIAGRMADALAWMYIAAATVNRHVSGQETDDVLFDWATTEALWQVQTALLGVIENLPNRFAAALLRACVFPLGARRRPPSDALTAAAGRALLDDATARARLTSEMFVPDAAEVGLGRLEHARDLAVAAAPLRASLRAHQLLSADEHALIREATEACEEAIRVDAYAPREYQHHVEPYGARSSAVAPTA